MKMSALSDAWRAFAFAKWNFVVLSLNHFACYLMVKTTFVKSALPNPFSQIYYNIPFNVNELVLIMLTRLLNHSSEEILSWGRFYLQQGGPGTSIIPPEMGPYKFLIRNSSTKNKHYFIFVLFCSRHDFHHSTIHLKDPLKKNRKNRKTKTK